MATKTKKETTNENTSQIKLGRLILDYDEWVVYEYDSDKEFKVRPQQFDIFFENDLEFDDEEVKFEVINGEAVVKLKPVIKFVRDI